MLHLMALADLHTHWMAHLAFGGHLMWGRPLGSMAEALPPCDGRNHGARFRVLGRDVSRQVLDTITRLEAEPVSPGVRPLHARHGFPDFSGWPTNRTMCHQQMHVEWVRRAYEGGLRLMTALAVNNRLLAWCMEGRREHWDNDAILQQIAATWTAAASPQARDWMEIALSAADAERIIGADRLAVVLGVEVDQIELLVSHDPRTLDELEEEASAYLLGISSRAARIGGLAQELYDLGVRQVTPIHMADNVFGGAALYRDAVASNSHWLELWRRGLRRSDHTGWPMLREPPSDVEFVLTPEQVPANRETSWWRPPVSRAVRVAAYADRAPGGHANARGLTAAGVVLLLELWKRGILVDVDHMSALTTGSAFDLAERLAVPVIASHCSFRAIAPTRRCLGLPRAALSPALPHEGMRTDDELRRLYRLGGIAGVIVRQADVLVDGSPVPVGTAAGTAGAYLHAVEVVGSDAAIALGTDMNGMNQAPRVLGQAVSGRPQMDGTKAWDIGRDGMAHYGLLPDLLRQWAADGVDDRSSGPLHRSAEGYVATWKRAEQASARLLASGDLHRVAVR
jgi:microsomal dipeptidase-like Zn-dependent dipeptidase